MSMDNQQFLSSLGITDEETRQACLEAMATYGDNRWWEPDVDPRKYAYYQINEPRLLGSFAHFHEATELLLGRPVFSHEFGINVDALKQEAERAWRWQIGCTSDEERAERVQAGLQRLKEVRPDVTIIEIERAG